MSKVLEGFVQRGKIDGYDDERSSGNGVIIHLPSGKQWLQDPSCHTRGFDTVTEAASAIRTGVVDYPDDPELKQR